MVALGIGAAASAGEHEPPVRERGEILARAGRVRAGHRPVAPGGEIDHPQPAAARERGGGARGVDRDRVAPGVATERDVVGPRLRADGEGAYAAVLAQQQLEATAVEPVAPGLAAVVGGDLVALVVGQRLGRGGFGRARE